MFLASSPRRAPDRRRRPLWTRLLLLWLMLAIGCGPVASAWAQGPVTGPGSGPGSGPGGSPGGGIVWKICDPPPQCFGSKEDKEKWAKDHNCRFIEEVCDQTTPDKDNQGAKPEDQGFWGSLWSSVQGGVTYGYEFVKGLYAGLKDQVTDLVKLITNAGDVVQGLIQLGKAFYNDPKATLASLADMLGQEAVDTITKATQCGAYDLGKVIGTYVSPAFALKLAQRLTKYSGKLADASKALKHEYGCASFAAGTMVLTPQGMLPIERIVTGQQVLSRNEHNFADKPQEVTRTLGRLAPTHRVLTTDRGVLRLTDEHPLWVQGKGWTEAAEVKEDDVVAGEHGDSLVQSNRAVAEPLRVYNFSVALTTNYFVGDAGMWVHNAGPCSIELYTKAWDKLSAKEKGFRGERLVFLEMKNKGYTPVGNSFNPTGKSPEEAFAAWDGQTGIDGLYKDADGNYVIVESKATGGKSNTDPSECVAKLCMMKTGERQMSDKWIKDRLDKMVPDPQERQKVLDALNDNKVTKVYAQADGQSETSGIIYNVIDKKGNTDVVIGDPWTP